ncbi:SDR family NAD(P)-dependent oxidoreductase [Flavisphingomonas formosensis]|uniref:SDR family NAD(P)-dependent oxidoreductase n=1 Tax=Flavisphingomonas formosensis TaxID=861534 RepID=UPI0018DFC620|nr:SDR family oxidoreductase [Sphingomonas formosensis]
MSLRGKIAIVTGGGTGIGRATSLKLAGRGADVAINYRVSRDEAEDTATACREFGVNAIAVAGDVGSDEDCRHLVTAAENELGGRVGILVNNAAATKFVPHAELDGLSGEDFESIFRTNVTGAYQMIRAAAPGMRAIGGGSVVNVASIAGLFGGGTCSAYSASKGALINLTKTLARALAPDIRVNVVCPGFVATRWFEDRMSPDDYAAALKKVIDAMPLGRAPTPEDIAGGIAYFCSADAATITGETLIMDAGAHLDLAISRGAVGRE